MIKTSALRPVVAIPARNEEKRLPTLLAALAAQTWQAASGSPLGVVVVLNNCDDGSRDAVSTVIATEPRLAINLLDLHFEVGDAHVGRARRLAMETALASGSSPEEVALLTTDADAVPSTDWVEANLRHLCEVDLVGGVIQGDQTEEAQLGPGFRRRASLHLQYSQLTDRLAAALDPIAHDPWPRHRDHTGASLAVRGSVYAAVGGLPALPFREDLGFVSRVASAGYRLRHPMDVRVTVSARLVGRAAGGMADCLKEWMREEASGAPLLVEDPRRVLARVTRRRRLRQLDHASLADRVALAYDLGLDPAALSDAGARPLSGDHLAEVLAFEEPDAPATIPVVEAITTLEVILTQIEEIARAA